MRRAQVTYLPGGTRLHLHHGPIDMIVGAEGNRDEAFTRAAARFETLLQELADELPQLRAPVGPQLTGETARIMRAAALPYASAFITPMAAVAGAGAETILAAMCRGGGLRKAYVNNGGDVAWYLGKAQSMTAHLASNPPAQVTVEQADETRGIATSGWQGRSQSRGIADSVTVLAASAAQADAAATMIANAVDLPGHPGITRRPAIEVFADSDLGSHLVTTDVPPLAETEISTALNTGAQLAQNCLTRGLITGAALMLQGQMQTVGQLALTKERDLTHA